MVPFIAVLAFLAVMTGVQAGDFLYRLDANLISKIDSETFKETMKLSLPIIENVYNNGKSSTSFTGEIKGLFTKVFGFDPESPVTILNVQSPMFMSYYNAQQLKLQKAQEEQNMGTGAEKMELGSTGIPGEAGAAGDGTGGAGTGKGGTGSTEGKDGTGGTDGKDSAGGTDNTGSEGNTGSTGNKDGTNSAGNTGGSGDTGSTDTKNNAGATDNTPGKEIADGKDNGGGTTNKGNSDPGTGLLIPPTGNPLDLQPASSIVYEEEDENEKSGSDTVTQDEVVIKNFTKHKIDIAALLKEPLNLKFDKKGPKVLIYHTHTSESYVLRPEDLGKKNVASYNTNPKYNVVRVGEELARYLKKYNIETLHNATVHDKVRSAAYGVAIETLQSYKKSYPSIKVFIDIHRDGLDASQPKLRTVKKINGKNAAQVMFVVGTDGLLPHPQWEENLKFVLRVQQKLNEKAPGLARPVWVVGKRYNQQISNQAVLLEVGGDGNLLSECLESMKYVAEALNDVMNGK
jgi:stage II sporulation protein P